jgi:hypothetical protein
VDIPNSSVAFIDLFCFFYKVCLRYTGNRFNYESHPDGFAEITAVAPSTQCMQALRLEPGF